jgi:hypothetical protein
MRRALLGVLGLAIACGGGGHDHDHARPDAAATPAVDAAPGGTPTAIELPQAIAGALLANPITYAALPVRVRVTGGADEVSVAIGGERFAAAAVSADEWLAEVPIATRADGVHAVSVVARGGGAEVSAEAELVLDRDGVQLTDFGVAGAAATPRLHRVGDELWLTWADRSDGPRKAWLRTLDGAGRWLGEPQVLVAGDSEVHAARAAVGADSIAVLVQRQGGPYRNFFTVVDAKGAEILAPIALDPDDRYGSFGGDIVFDGESYLAVWRTNDGAGAGEIRWLRYHEASGDLVGPVVVAASGDGDPIAGFEPFTVIAVAPAGGGDSLVSFVRKRHDAILELEVPRSEVARVAADGTVTAVELAGGAGDFTWHHECRVFAGAELPVALWTAGDLTASEPIPTVLYGARGAESAVLDPQRARVIDAAEHRSEPALIAGGHGEPILAWLDQRSKAGGAGKIELWAAELGADLSAPSTAVFAHAVFIENTSQLGGAPLGSNAMLVWLDERHGSGLFDPRPEVWLETVWR